MAMMADVASRPVQTRYRDAYSVAQVTIAWGTLLKILGIIAGVATVFLGFVAATNFGMGAIIASFVVAASVAGIMYALGVTVAAQGQIIRAILDTAVNTSPLLSTEQKREVIVASGGHEAAPAPIKGEWLTCRSCGKLVRLEAGDNKCHLGNQVA